MQAARRSRYTIEVTDKVGGYMPGGGGLGALAALVDSIVTTQVKRLAQFVVEPGR